MLKLSEKRKQMLEHKKVEDVEVIEETQNNNDGFAPTISTAEFEKIVAQEIDFKDQSEGVEKPKSLQMESGENDYNESDETEDETTQEETTGSTIVIEPSHESTASLFAFILTIAYPFTLRMIDLWFIKSGVDDDYYEIDDEKVKELEQKAKPVIASYMTNSMSPQRDLAVALFATVAMHIGGAIVLKNLNKKEEKQKDE